MRTGAAVTGEIQMSVELETGTGQSYSRDDLTPLVRKACLIARDAVFNAKDLLENSSRIAFLAIRDCERELDKIEREIDEKIAGAITRAGEKKARRLLACLKFITDLERIGDLIMGAAHRLHHRTAVVSKTDRQELVEMTSILCEMLEGVHLGFATNNPECGRKVLLTDARVDASCRALFQRHLASKQASPHVFEVMLVAQAFERAGDHAKNLAEELVSLSEGRSLRHASRRS